MNNEKQEGLMLHLFVAVATLAIAVGARIVAVRDGADQFTANAIFIGTMVALAALYLAIRLAVYSATEYLLNRFAPKPKPIAKIEIAEEPKQEVEEKREEKKMLDLEKIRNESREKVRQDLESKIDLALQYTQRIFAPHVSDDDMSALLYNIELYANNNIEIGIQPIRVRGLISHDLYHYGWNLWNHFGVMDQMATAGFLQEVFHSALQNIESIETIKKKLRVDDNNTKISLEDRLK